jgi:transcriptional regulator with XRE-family HTH domain
MPGNTIGERLLALKEQSGLSLAKIATAAGYQGASSIQKLFQPEYNPKRLNKNTASRLASALANHGTPPILAAELHVLAQDTSEEDSNRRFINDIEAKAETIFLFETGLSSRIIKASDGYRIPSFTIDLFNLPEMISTPEHLKYRGISGFRVVTGNMWPKYDIGEAIWYSEGDAFRIGDVLVAGIKPEDGRQLDAYILGRLIDMNDEEIKLSQLKPERVNVLARTEVQSLRRVLTYEDLLPLSILRGGPDTPID